MAALDSTLRSNFEKEVIKARDEAESAAQAALATLAVERDRPFDSMGEEKRELRRALRARARQLGEGDMNAGMPRLIEEIAYEQWHRMLFARFLAENDLLMHPEGVAVTLEECAELAQEEGAEDLWAVATRYASLMLPGIFRVDDPALQVRFAPEGRHKLEQIVTDLPRGIFTSDDGLGWAYQFWQSKKKDEVNASERKIGGADIAPVTQLFTEDYMVKFLLHNTLGAWWAHRHPDSPLNKTFEYLRYREDGTPAAGTFDGWPDKVVEVTMMDPCGGSGHFVVAAFEIFARIRMEEEGLNAAAAGDAVIRDNVHMLELDLRCTQIAAFSLALAAWKFGGYRELPALNIACSGISAQGQLQDWKKFAGSQEALAWTLERLHHLFANATHLGSLINPALLPVEERLFVGDYHKLEPIITKALREEASLEEPLLFGSALQSLVNTTRLLSRDFTLVATNVPYLTRNKQAPLLQEFSESTYPDGAADLSTVFVERCREFTKLSGTYAIVTPQNWLSQVTYRKLRERILRNQALQHISWLGPGAFETITGEVVKPVLLIATNQRSTDAQQITSMDVSQEGSATKKSRGLRQHRLELLGQRRQLSNPDSRIIFGASFSGPLLEEYADALQGISPADLPQFGRYFWEVIPDSNWHYWQGGPSKTKPYGGRSRVLWWNEDLMHAVEIGKAYIRGEAGWGKKGVAVRQMGDLPCTIYTGEKADTNVAAIIPKNPDHLAAIWAFCKSAEYRIAVRRLDRKMNVTNATLAKVPFDLERWTQAAESDVPIPEPYSDEPTQWLFQGRPESSREPLQVAVARLLAYRWPLQRFDGLMRQADDDGIVCLPSLIGEPPAAERLRSLLAAAYSNDWSAAKQSDLLHGVGFGGKRLNAWLRDGFFRQHCQLFGNRPFIWHIWDGRKDGFSALINYHKLDQARLERLIYTYLGDWISTQRAEREQGVAGAEGRLVAALELKKKLELILEGEPPYDIYVRWKPLHEQPIGWNPDLNDGVRLNIRPFVTAGVLRSKFTIHWKKDRGKNPDGSERHNDLHFTRAEKEAAREAALKTR